MRNKFFTNSIILILLFASSSCGTTRKDVDKTDEKIITKENSAQSEKIDYTKLGKEAGEMVAMDFILAASCKAGLHLSVGICLAADILVDTGIILFNSTESAEADEVTKNIDNKIHEKTSQISATKEKEFHKIYSGTTLPSPTFLCDGEKFTSFSTNNYLGLAHHPEVISAAKEGLKLGLANTESRLLGGDLQIYHELENKIAKMKGKEAAIIFASGFMTNFSVLSSIPNISLNARMYGYPHGGIGKWVYFSDEFNHTSINVGISASRAKIVNYPHINIEALEILIKENAAIPNKLIITDSIFSVDGDICPLDKILELAEKYDAMIYVDDAHGTGILGKNGAGVMLHFNLKSDRIIHMGTLSKAYGSIGGFIAANEGLVNMLRFVCSGYVFTSTIPQDQAFGLIAAIDVIEKNPQLIKNLWENQKYFIEKMKGLPYQIMSKTSPIIPLLIGDEELAEEFTKNLRKNYIHVDSVKFPSVPYGKARLRVMMNACHTKEQIDKLIDVLDKNKHLLTQKNAN